MKKNILFVVTHFYPNGAVVESKNNYLTVLELEKYGFRVDVAAPAGKEKYPSNVKYLLEKNSRIGIREKLYKNIRLFLRIPYIHIRFDKVSSIINHLQVVDFLQYDYIYTVFGNGSEHIVGVRLKKKFPHLKLIAEFRDPWVHNEIIKKYLFDKSFLWYAKYQQKKLLRIEKRVLESVDLLLVESRYHGNQITRDFGYTKKIYVCNGFSSHFLADLPSLNVEFTCKPVIGFMGSTYYGYDHVAKTFIQVLEELETEGIEFTFVTIGENAFSDFSSSTSLTNFYPIHKVSYIKSQAFIKKFTYGLAITMNGHPGHVNSKIFEYMQFKKPTLAIAPPGGEMDRLLVSTNTGYLISYNREIMKEQLRDILLHKSKSNTDLLPDQVKPFGRKYVFQSIVNAIEELG